MGILYKYTSFENARYILRNKCLPLGHISNYNDPYECSIDCIDEELMALGEHMTNDQKKEWIARIIDKIAEKEKWNREMKEASIKTIGAYGAKTLAPFNLLGAILLMGGAYVYSTIVGNGGKTQLTPKHVDKYMQRLLPCLAQTYTSCMSECKDVFLLWSHYADSHKGIVIEFDLDKFPFISNPPLPMNYSDERFTLDADRLLACDVNSDIKTMLVRKNKVWKYEKEYRFLFDAQNKSEQIIWYDHNENPIIKLDDDAINAVYFGCRVTIEKIKQIKDILSSQGRLEYTKMYKCKLSDTNYRLDFVKIK